VSRGLAGVGALAVPFVVIAGVYGMNCGRIHLFRHPDGFEIMVAVQVALGVGLIVVAVMAGPVLGWLSAPTHRPPHAPVVAWLGGVTVPAVIVTLGPLLAGIGVLTTSLGGLYWVPAAVAAVSR